jgi:UDP-glucose 4-epimerase
MVDVIAPRSLVLVTGGAGFIGAHCVRRLLAGGHAVRVLDNLSGGRREALPGDDLRLDFRLGDIRDPQAVAAAMAGATQVLHLAAQVSVAVSVAAPLESASTNLTGFLNVLEAARQAGVRRFVYASSAAVYGNAEAPQREDLEPAPRSPYALEKRVNEQYAALYQQLHGLPALGLRYFNVYGPGQCQRSDYAGVIARFSQCVRAGEPVTLHGDGAQTRDFIHVEDVARLSCQALVAEATGVINIGTGRGESIANLLQSLMRLHGPVAVHASARQPGDVDHSRADPARCLAVFGSHALLSLQDGLRTLGR